MRLFTIIPVIFLLVLSCSKQEAKLSDSCIDIIESDTFYFALPLDGQHKVMYRLEDYLIQVIDSRIQTIDFNCAVVVTPTNKQIDKLRKDFNENLEINTKHSEAVICMIESKGIPALAATGQFIRFIGKDRTWDLDIRKDTFPDWKFILFKETGEPVILPSLYMTIEEVEQYFESEG